MTPLLVSMTTINSYGNANKRTRGLGHLTYICVSAARWDLMYSEGKGTAHLTKLCCVSRFQGSVGRLAKGEVGASLSSSGVLQMHFSCYFEEIS